MYGIYLGILKTITTYTPRIKHAECSDRLYTFITLCSPKRVTSTATNTKRTYTTGIYTRILRYEIHHTMNIFYPVGRTIRIPRLTTTCSLITRIGSDSYISKLCQPLRIETRNLFFHAPIRMSNNNSYILF